MVDPNYRGEGNGVVAILADIGRLDVCWSLADGLYAVMAAKAVAHDVVMIEIGGNPAAGGMAVVTTVAAGNVIDTFPFGDGAVMAGYAGAQHLKMIDSYDRIENLG